MVTWHATHCCNRCRDNGTHGPFCNKLWHGGDDNLDEDEVTDDCPVHDNHDFAPEDNTSESSTSAMIVATNPFFCCAPPAPAETDGWYPGKHLKAAQRRISAKLAEVKAAKARGQYQPPRRPVLAIRAALKPKRQLARRTDNNTQCGSLQFSVLGGHTPGRSRTYWVAELDGNECQTRTAMCSSPSWEGEDFELPIFDPSSDLRLYLFDDEHVHSERPVGRVILPLVSLCAHERKDIGGGGGSSGVADHLSSLLPRAPARAQRLLLRVLPIGPQHSSVLHARLNEACPGFPGSGLVRKELGSIELLVRLRFDLPASSALGLLAAYAAVPPAGSVHRDDEEEEEEEAERVGGASAGRGGAEEEEEEALQPKLLKLHALRLSRCVGRPHLLIGPTCLLMPCVLYLVCFRLPLAALPWACFCLAVANGALGSRRRPQVTEQLIFWEEEVGESAVPKGPIAKLKLLTKGLGKLQRFLGMAATSIEKSQNFLSWADAPVTLAATSALFGVCLVASLILWAVTPNVLVFAFGMAGLSPCLLSEARQQLGLQQHATSPRPAASSSPRGAGGGVGVGAGAGGSTGGSRGCSKKAFAPITFRMLRNVLARVPDAQEIAHQHFARTWQIIEAEEVVETNAEPDCDAADEPESHQPSAKPHVE